MTSRPGQTQRQGEGKGGKYLVSGAGENLRKKVCVAFATRAFANPIFVASATPIFVASATPYFRTFATRTAATPKKNLIFHLFKRFKMTNFSLEVVMDEVLDM